jgi:hypothetical protein
MLLMNTTLGEDSDAEPTTSKSKRKLRKTRGNVRLFDFVYEIID